MSEDATRKAVTYLGYTITRGKLKPCEACRVSKANQAAAPKVSTRVHATQPNERIWLDISTLSKNHKMIPRLKRFTTVTGEL